jgi:AraC-like DNA-binding protein
MARWASPAPGSKPLSKDTLSELLRAVRLRGAIYYYVDGFAPWVAEAPHAREIAAAVIPGAEHLIEYHVVTRGACWGAIAGEPAVRLEQGDLIMFPQGDAHVMSSAPGMRVPEVDRSLFFSPKPPQLPYVLTQRGARTQAEAAVDTVRLDGGGESSTVVCGFLGCDARPFNPLLNSLPRLLHMKRAATAGTFHEQFMALAVDETSRKRPGGEAVLERLSELMFVDVVRRYLESLPPGETGWLAGLRDRYVGRALAFLHERPSHGWTIDELTHAVGLSRSALHERFTAMVGQSPMQYLTHWRMQVASRLLSETTLNMAAVALEAGYDSEAAFSRAFKRAVGVPPAMWRRERAASASRTIG